jgi:hypothetical protein
MGWLAHIHLPHADTSLQPFGCLGGSRLSLISVGWVAVSVAAGPGVEGQTLERVVSPEPDLYLRLFVRVGNRQMAAAAVFAVAFRFVMVVFRYIRAYQSKIAKLKDSYTVLYAKYRIFSSAQVKNCLREKYATILRILLCPLDRGDFNL